MSKGNWITLGIFVLGLIGAALKLAHEVGRVAVAVENNTKAIESLNGDIDDLDHTWAVRLGDVEDDVKDLERDVGVLQGRHAAGED